MDKWERQKSPWYARRLQWADGLEAVGEAGPETATPFRSSANNNKSSRWATFHALACNGARGWGGGRRRASTRPRGPWTFGPGIWPHLPACPGPSGASIWTSLGPRDQTDSLLRPSWPYFVTRSADGVTVVQSANQKTPCRCERRKRAKSRVKKWTLRFLLFTNFRSVQP